MDRRNTLGWTAVGISTAISSLWAFWGIFESFHEGWYFDSLIRNLVLTARYLTLMLVFLGLSVVALRWPRAGGGLYQLFAIGFCVWVLMTRSVLDARVVLGWMPAILPPLLVGGLFWLGRPQPLRLAYGICTLVPLAVAFGFTVEPATRIASRVDDGDRGLRLVEGNGVTLVWAPEGPGWPRPDPDGEAWRTRWRGPTWQEARSVARRLTADGESVTTDPQDIWRLPTIDEVVRSMARHGVNCGGAWDPATGLVSYRTRPDKEPPLWNPYSVVIYWWTSSEASEGRAYAIDFKGNVYARDKRSTLGSQGFRAVRDAQMDLGPAGVSRDLQVRRDGPPDTPRLAGHVRGSWFEMRLTRAAAGPPPRPGPGTR